MKRQVLVYYSNETTPGLLRLRDIEARIGRIRLSACEQDIARADRVEADIRRFPRTTQQQVVELRRVIREHAPDNLAGFLAFTNETAGRGWYEIQRSGEDRIGREAFPRVIPDDPKAEDFPLAGPASLRAALGTAARHFDPCDHEFLLITRSHGTDVMAITPALIEATLDGGAADVAYRPASSGSPGEKAALVALGPAYGVGGEGLVLGGLDEAARGLAVTKEALLDILGEAGSASGMHFRLVFMDSCGSEVPRELAREVPANLGTLYGSTPDGLGYEVPDYASLGRGIDPRADPEGLAGAIEWLLDRTENVTRFALDGEGTRRMSL